MNEVKLPRSINGKKLPKHPLLMTADEHTVPHIARVLGLHKASVYQYTRRCVLDRDVRVPPAWVLKLSELSGLPPYAFRPDIYPSAGVEGV